MTWKNYFFVSFFFSRLKAFNNAMQFTLLDDQVNFSIFIDARQ